ncbi:uncharacterized protein [Diabrotica undecimpunctata]|uniref:uncharacterized protein n=1 Tax=Diabrotica undecimpunctata TaxID=50387 RepID=UPI003B640009
MNEILEGEVLYSSSDAEWQQPAQVDSTSDDDTEPIVPQSESNVVEAYSPKADVEVNMAVVNHRSEQKDVIMMFFLKIPVGSEIIAPDGTLWKIEALYNTSARRRVHQNVFKDISGPTPYAQRRVDETCNSAWRFLIHDKILKHITDCTIQEARQVHSNTWSLTIEELEAFIAIIYVRGAMGAKGIDLDSLWSE